MNTLPIIGITLGDPAGVGPEIIVKVLSESDVYKICRPVVFGDRGVLDFYLKEKKGLSIREISHPSEAEGRYGEIDVVEVCRLDMKRPSPGIPNVEGGIAMMNSIFTAVDMAKRHDIAGMVTCPISKALMHVAGYRYEGHTQLIAELTDTKLYTMMLAGPSLRIALATVHCALKDVPHLLTTQGILNTISVTSRALYNDFGLESPRIAVAGLNPHAGEGGLFGTEEREVIEPAVRTAGEKGYKVEGPFSPDTIFRTAASGHFDAVIAMYHDQGLIPLKLLHFSDAVNVTLGLPIVRTSVDHGTAYDIAGKGAADPSSLKAAIKTAVFMSQNRKARRKAN